MKQKSGIVNPFNKQGTISRQSRGVSNFSCEKFVVAEEIFNIAQAQTRNFCRWNIV